MDIAPDMIGKIENIAAAALTQIGAGNVPQKVKRAVKFCRSQPPAEIMLDGEKIVAVAVDIATEFSLEPYYRHHTDDNNIIRTVEFVKALSIVVYGDQVRLCKSTFDVIPGAAAGEERFVNSMYWTTDIPMLFENYIC